MKTKKLILFIGANLIAVIAILLIVERKNMVSKYGDRFKRNAFIMSDSVIVDSDHKSVYNFYIHHYDEVYSKTADIHHEFVLLNTDSITEGTKIYCREGKEDAMIHHDYIVKKVIPNRMIYKASEPSVVHNKTKKGVYKTTCNAFVYVDFQELDDQKSLVKFTIIVQMPNYFYRLMGRIIGGKKAKTEWEDHLNEELVGFRDMYYKESENI